MPDLQGTVIIAPITPTHTDDRYPTHLAVHGSGGYRTVQSLSERDAISDERREEGMLVWIEDDKRLFRLTTGTTNSDWEDLGRGAVIYEPVCGFNGTEPEILFSSEGDVLMQAVSPDLYS